MLTVYRRHLRRCEHRAEGRKYRRCKCPLWVDGFLNGVEIRKALGIRDWEKAQETVRDWEAEGQQNARDDRSIAPTSDSEARGPISLADAWRIFCADLQARKLHASTIRKYKLLRRTMQEFTAQRGFRSLVQLDVRSLTEFRTSWKDGPLSSSKKLERLRSFFQFCIENNWIPENPARKLKAPRILTRPTLPFSSDEMLRVLGALEPYVRQVASRGKANARRLRGLVLVLRYTGMRIGDAVQLTTDQVTGNKLFLYTQKTGVPVYTVLPSFVVSALETIPRVTERCFFWDGSHSRDAVVGSWQRRLRRLFQLAQITNGHAHRFRDTFAVELLLTGIPIERVSILLGHQSTRITERHYSPWTRSRQEQVEADLMRAWERDPVVLLETKGTRQVRGENALPN